MPELNPTENTVALYTSAWIEIIVSADFPAKAEVALYTSAWIEML